MSNYPNYSDPHTILDREEQRNIYAIEQLQREMDQLALQRMALSPPAPIRLGNGGIPESNYFTNTNTSTSTSQIDYYDYYRNTQTQTRSPRFIGGPKDGESISSFDQRIYDGRIIWRESRIPSPAVTWNESLVDPYVTMETVEHIYERHSDGNYYCESDSEIELSREEEDMVRATSSNKFTIDDRVKLKFASHDSLWRETRSLLKGHWKQDPEWCCGKLSNFIGDFPTSRCSQLGLVMNYLTNSFFKMSGVSHRSIEDLKRRLSVEIAKRRISGRWERSN